MNPNDSQSFESYVPVYSAIPDKWEDARNFLVETLKLMSNAINIRTIGWYLDEELLSGNAFLPVPVPMGSASPPQYRAILRKVIDFGALTVGLNQRPHGILFDSRFTLIHMWGSATRITPALAFPIPDGVGTGSAINMDSVNVNIATTVAVDRCIVVIEYIQEI